MLLSVKCHKCGEGLPHVTLERNCMIYDDDWILRPMLPEDYDKVHKLWTNIKGFGIRAIDDSREDIERFILRNPTTSVVACVGDKIVGSILCGHDGRQASFYHVCVAKAYRRRGIGSAMVIHCMNVLRKLKINKIALIAFTSNDAGNAFWKQIGWRYRPDCNYYEFLLNEENITRFIESETEE